MVHGLRVTVARLLTAAFAASLFVPVVAFASASVARAGVDCGIGDPPWYEITVSRRDVMYTHTVNYVTLPPGASATRTISRTTTLTGSVEIEVGGEVSASAILAGASAKVGVKLRGEGSATDGSSLSITVKNATSRYHDYVFFNGTRTANGRWTRYYCSAGAAKASGWGTWFSWEAQYYGAIRCDNDSMILSKYGQWSVQYKAASSCS